MYDDKKQDATHGPQGPYKDIKRMELLVWQFSAAEIERLIKCQLRYQERMNALDLPIDLYRLRFARWLVEHGKMTEDIESEPDASDGTATDGPGHPRNANLALKYMPTPYWYAQPRPRRSPSHRGIRWRRSISSFMSRLQREITRSSVKAPISSWPGKPGR